MTFICPECGTNCRPVGDNVVGVEIQEYVAGKGWVSTSRPYGSYCRARNKMVAMNSNTELRVYPALTIPP